MAFSKNEIFDSVERNDLKTKLGELHEFPHWLHKVEEFKRKGGGWSKQLKLYKPWKIEITKKTETAKRLNWWFSITLMIIHCLRKIIIP